jgi:uncharacterized membrane protein (DUF2068 family)
MQQTLQKRPTGLTIIVILTWIGSAFSLLLTILGLLGTFLLSKNGTGPLTTTATIFLIFFGLLAIAEFIVGWGLWTLKRWAFWVTVIVETIHIAGNLYSWLAGHTGFGNIAFSLTLGLVIVVYLFADANARAAFRI